MLSPSVRTLFPLLCWSVLTMVCTTLVEAAETRPNVVIFLVDDMGLMDTSVPFLADPEGNPERHPLNDYYQTPNMEKLAERSIRFAQFYANSVCSPSRISLMTGQSSARHKTTAWINPTRRNKGPAGWRWKGLNRESVTLPRLLQSDGYRTIHVGKAHFGPVGSDGADPTKLGFDVNIAGSSIGRPKSYFGQDDYGKGDLRQPPHLEAYHGTGTHLSDALTLEMCKAIDAAVSAKKPFFAHLSHYAVHSPFQEDPRFADQYHDRQGKRMPAFASLIAGMDKSLGDLMNHLEKIGVAENTLVFFLGDNGSDAPMDAHQHDIASSAPLRGKKGAHYEGGMRVPFMAGWAKRNADSLLQRRIPIAQGVITSKSFASIEDLMPAVLAATGTEAPDGHRMDGRNILPALQAANEPTGRKRFLMHFPHSHRSNYFTVYREGNWKVIRHYGQKGAKAFELFDLEKDPTESHDLGEVRPERLSAMRDAMQEGLKEAGALYVHEIE